jgi:hypothetical protein
MPTLELQFVIRVLGRENNLVFYQLSALNNVWKGKIMQNNDVNKGSKTSKTDKNGSRGSDADNKRGGTQSSGQGSKGSSSGSHSDDQRSGTQR